MRSAATGRPVAPGTRPCRPAIMRTLDLCASRGQTVTRRRTDEPLGHKIQATQYLKGSLWVLPLCGCIIGVLLAQLLLWIDHMVHIETLMHYSSGTATGVLTAIIGAMVALLGFVVTIGVLVIQQATATLSPRFMRLWYRDRLQKVVLATFAGMFIYSFALLRPA